VFWCQNQAVILYGFAIAKVHVVRVSMKETKKKSKLKTQNQKDETCAFVPGILFFLVCVLRLLLEKCKQGSQQ
jgi:NADH:ubiquinone oxidoreductase subunit 6 (subunit J)